MYNVEDSRLLVVVKGIIMIGKVMMVCSEIKLQIDNPWLGGGKVNEEDVKMSYKKPIAAPFQARAIRPVRHKLEAVTAPFF